MKRPSVAFLMCARDKAAFIRTTAASLLEQTYSPMTIVFSDHGSTDGTGEILTDLAATYEGPNEIRLLSCPDTKRRGLLGLNAHLDWCMRQLDHDIVIFASADDLTYPTRAEKVVKAFADTDCDYVASRLRYINDDGPLLGVGVNLHQTGLASFALAVAYQIGIQCGCAWKRGFWLHHGPMRGVEAPDLTLSCLAALQGGLYFINETLHDGYQIADPNGVSIERAIQAAEDEEQKWPLRELNCYQFCTGWFALRRRILEAKLNMGPEGAAALHAKLTFAGELWCMARDRLSMERISPIAMPI